MSEVRREPDEASMTAKLYTFPSGEQLKGPKMDGGFYVCAIVAVFAVTILAIKLQSR